MIRDNLNLLDQNELKQLLQQPSGICISIFLPTHRIQLDKQREDQIKLKNLIREAESQIAKYAPELTVPEVQQLLEPATRLLDAGLFWKEQKDGLAIFLSGNFNRIYSLPFDFEQSVKVANRFHILPLLPLFMRNGRFFILALSQNEIRLFQSSRYRITEIELDEIPTSLDEAVAYDEPERQLQFHTRTGPSAAVGDRVAAYHGHGVSDEKKTNILRYFRKVDAGLQEILREANAPLVLAGVDFLFSIYREANTYPHLLDEGIPGNPENVLPGALQQEAWEIVRPHFLQAQQDAAERYGYFANNNQASCDLNDFAHAAGIGRVKTLFITKQSHPVPSSEELIDLAAAQTILYGGNVYLVAQDTMPGESPIAAIFRY